MWIGCFSWESSGEVVCQWAFSVEYGVSSYYIIKPIIATLSVKILEKSLMRVYTDGPIVSGVSASLLLLHKNAHLFAREDVVQG